MECCRDGCSSGRFSSLHREKLELCQSDHRALGHLPDKGSSPQIAQFGREACSSMSPGGSKSESESALFAKCAQTHKEFVVVFKKLLVHTCIHTYIYTYISDMRTEHLNKT